MLVIGADCECGLDKNWLQGTMLPMLWDKKTLGRITKNLGFDPENPLIKIEINQIMRTGRYEYGKNSRHTETMFGQDSAYAPALTSKLYEKTQTDKQNLTAPLDSSRRQSESKLKRSILITAGILSALLVIGLFFVYRHAKSN